MLVSTKQMLQNAYEGHYAVAAINTQGGTYDIIRAVCMAAGASLAGDSGALSVHRGVFR